MANLVKTRDAKPRAFAPSAWQPVPENEVFYIGHIAKAII